MVGSKFTPILKLGVCLLATVWLGACSDSGEGIGPSEAPPSTPGSSLVSPVVITSPISTQVTKLDALTITGTCLNSATVAIVGPTDTTLLACTNGAFSADVQATSDGNLKYSIYQGFSATRISSAVVVNWTRDTTAPTAPKVKVNNQSSNPYYSNGSSITITGDCENNATVNITGDATGAVTCASSSYSFSVSKSVDATYSFSVSQTDLAGNISTSSTSFQWIRDTVAPSAPTLTLPSVNPYLSADTDLTFGGACEANATVYLFVGATQQDLVGCVGGAYQFSVSQSVDGIYNYAIKQSDRAGNVSSSTNFQWTRDTGIPTTPVVDSPVNVTNTNSIAINGDCTNGNTVYLSGDDTQNMACAANRFAFTVSKGADATYNFGVIQKTGANVSSASASVSWLRDTVAPALPVVSNPASSPFYSNGSSLSISGTCELNATVNLAGAASMSAGCATGTYSFNVPKTVDGTYDFTVSQSDPAGNTSSTVAKTWIRDTVAPSAPTVTSQSSPYLSNGGSVTISGACETNAVVALSGSATNSATCAASAYSFVVAKGTDGTYNFTLIQTDAAGNASASTAFTWQRDATAPSTPTILSPATSPFTSAGSTLAISGGCETGATVAISGDYTNSIVCAANSYSFSVNQGSDGTYNFTINQTDAATNVSGNATLQWIRSSAIPTTPVVTTPSVNPFYSNGSSLTISGACTSGNTVELSGDGSGSVSCTSSAFSISVSKSTDATYVINVRQKSPTLVYSGAATVTWIRDTVAPSNPTVTSPAVSPYYSNGSSINISGACETGATVSVSGSAAGSTTCSASAYSIPISKAADGTYTFSVKQVDLAGNNSGSVALTWVRDTAAPAMPSLLTPSSNPFISNSNSVNVTVLCEASAVVSLVYVSSPGSAVATATKTCDGTGHLPSPFTINGSIDGDYVYSIYQTDRASNQSTIRTLTWTRDTTIPSTPDLTVAGSGGPIYSNASTVTLSVVCESVGPVGPTTVDLSGDVDVSEVTSPAGSLTQDCISSPVTFTVQKTIDASYSFAVTQTSQAGITSASDVLMWTRDTAPPSAPTITAPAASPFTAPGNLTISGGCEVGATVYLTGSSTDNILCASGTYSFSVVETSDATYTFSVTQKDLAQNSSSSTNLTWIRDSNSVQPPVITTPASSPALTNTTSLLVQGTCTSGYLVTLGGNVVASDVSTPLHSLTQSCVGGSFSYVIDKSSDSSYTFSFKQTFNAVDSTSTSITWNRDTTPPTATITANPANPNIAASASFSFSSNESGSTFLCSMDSGTFASCSSPFSWPSQPANGNRSFSVKAIDPAGNTGSAVTFNWQQASYLTIGLYHMANTNDSGLFTSSAAFNNNLVAVGSPTTDTTGKLPTGTPSSKSLTGGAYYMVPHNNSLNSGTDAMTIEGFFKINASPSARNNYYTLVSKTAASPNLGWEIRLRRSSTNTATNTAIDFVRSLNGTSSTSSSSSSTTINVGTWYYFYVSWNFGQIKVYIGSSTVSSKLSTGTVGSTLLFATTGDLKIGANLTSGTNPSQSFNGVIDELRISQTIRTAPSSVPTVEFTAD